MTFHVLIDLLIIMPSDIMTFYLILVPLKQMFMFDQVFRVFFSFHLKFIWHNIIEDKAHQAVSYLLFDIFYCWKELWSAFNFTTIVIETTSFKVMCSFGESIQIKPCLKTVFINNNYFQITWYILFINGVSMVK